MTGVGKLGCRLVLSVCGGPTAAMFGLYALVVTAVLTLASLDSPVAMLAVGAILAGFVAALVWCSGLPSPRRTAGQPEPEQDQ